LCLENSKGIVDEITKIAMSLHEQTKPLAAPAAAAVSAVAAGGAQSPEFGTISAEPEPNRHAWW